MKNNAQEDDFQIVRDAMSQHSRIIAEAPAISGAMAMACFESLMQFQVLVLGLENPEDAARIRIQEYEWKSVVTAAIGEAQLKVAKEILNGLNQPQNGAEPTSPQNFPQIGRRTPKLTP